MTPLRELRRFASTARLDVRGTATSWAAFSADQRYRYVLVRQFSEMSLFGAKQPPRPILVSCGLNPSTADERANDPTIARLVKRAESGGHVALVMLNAFGLRSTDPRGLLEEFRAGGDPVGQHNDRVMTACRQLPAVWLACWGAPKWKPLEARLGRLRGFADWHVLDTTADGRWPRHPLYLRDELQIRRWA